MTNITIIGDGGWGTTLAIYLARKNCHVTLWSAFPDYARHLRLTRENKKFLPGITIPKKISILDNLKTAVAGAQLIIFAVPSEYATSALKKLRKFDLSKKVFLSVVKGIEIKTLRRISEVIYARLGKVPLAVLSGPTIAREIAAGIPSTAVIASHDHRLGRELQHLINSPTFRIYTNTDVVGVEIGGSIKNVIAIACGVCDGLGLGANTKAAIVTRGLAEMIRLGTALGAEAKTFAGLSGLGDLVTTCMSPQSRNRFVGEQLGKGKTIGQIKKTMAMVAEGVPTVKAIHSLSRKYNISMPITTEVYNIIYRQKKPMKAVVDLMTRKLKAE